MPKYRYRCPNCGEEFTKIEQVNPDARRCPECGAEAEREKVNSFSPRYKGEGFYSTDYGGSDE